MSIDLYQCMEKEGIPAEDSHLRAIKVICKEQRLPFEEACKAYKAQGMEDSASPPRDPIGAIVDGFMPDVELLSQVSADLLVEETRHMTGGLYLKKLCRSGAYRDAQLFRQEDLLQQFRAGSRPHCPEPRNILRGAEAKALGEGKKNG